MMPTGYSTASIGLRLTDQEAKGYASQLERPRRYRVTVFSVGFGSSTIELRPLPGQPWRPTRILRTVADCEAVLAELRPLAEPTSGATE